jgi:tetratricopeptide (TPR) repeat protein
MSEPEAPIAENDAGSPEGESPEQQQNLYEQEVERYKAALNRDLEHAHKRYGFTLFHSLPGPDVVELRQKLGLMGDEATDIYNLGCVAAEKEDYAEAVARFKEAMKKAPELAEAEFNLAVALARSGDAAAAKAQFESYLKREALSEEEIAAVGECVQELK